MIFERSLRRELAFSAGAVFLVLLTIFLTTMMIRIVGFAASGEVDPRDVVALIGLTILGYTAVMLVVTLFVSILMTLTRWYRDSEMAVWHASGVGLTAFIRPIATFSAPIIVLIAICATVVLPWANAQRNLLKDRFAQRDDIALLAPGQFRESTASHRVFFIEKISSNARTVHNVFVTNTENGKLSVVVARDGEIETQPDGSRFVVLEAGRRYDGEPGRPDFRVMEFQRYGVKIKEPPAVISNATSGLPTIRLLQQPTPENLGELAWRIGLPLAGIALMLLAIPLSYQNPRRDRTLNLVLAVLIYLTYTNLLNLMQSWIDQQKVPFIVGTLALHVLVIALAIALLARRVRNRPLFPRKRLAAKKAS